MSFDKLNLHNFQDLKLTITPTDSSKQYTFYVSFVNHVDSAGDTYSLITIVPHSKESICGNNCNNNFNKNFITSSLTSVTANQVESKTCSDENRPPAPPPENRNDSTKYLPIDTILRATAQQAATHRAMIKSATYNNSGYTGMVSTEAQISSNVMVMQYYYLWGLHSPGGLLDMSHNNNNRTYNSSADMGNFIFGANLAAMGYSETEISSLSAAAQPITDAYSSGCWVFRQCME